MLKLRAACLAAAVAFIAATHAMSAAAGTPLSLDEAFRRVIDTHPDLAVLRHRRDAVRADIDQAAQTPGFSVALGAENAFGTGAASGINGLELTVSLASVLERGDKRGARMALASRRYDEIDLLREGRRLDLLAEVARRYLDVASAQALAAVARSDVAQRERTIEAANLRVQAGASPASVPLAAEAARARAQLEVDRAQRHAAIARRRLALMWGETSADFEIVAGDLSVLPQVDDLDALLARLDDTPELRRFAHESRLREARLQLARTARVADIGWEVGLRRLEATDDWGLMARVSIPLGSSARAEPGIRSAQADLAAIELEREGESRQLEATLAEAWGQLEAAVALATQIREQLVPRLEKAERAAGDTYRLGALSYLDWAQLQSDTLLARRQELDASLAAHRALIELQRLTGESLLVVDDKDKDATP
jgi:cobalt-zinc-cadmium efflux system outer membrane protein